MTSRSARYALYLLTTIRLEKMFLLLVVIHLFLVAMHLLLVANHLSLDVKSYRPAVSPELHEERQNAQDL